MRHTLTNALAILAFTSTILTSCGTNNSASDVKGIKSDINLADQVKFDGTVRLGPALTELLQHSNLAIANTCFKTGKLDLPIGPNFDAIVAYNSSCATAATVNQRAVFVFLNGRAIGGQFSRVNEDGTVEEFPSGALSYEEGAGSVIRQLCTGAFVHNCDLEIRDGRLIQITSKVVPVVSPK